MTNGSACVHLVTRIILPMLRTVRLPSPYRHPRSDCTHELFAVQCALRLALCTPSAPGRRHGRCKRGSGTSSSLLTGLGTRRAHATLLIGHLVEIGAPGWRETKAIMVPPFPQLMQAAEAPSDSEVAATLLSDSRWAPRFVLAIVSNFGVALPAPTNSRRFIAFTFAAVV